jgi:hypothetical protein
MASGLRRQMRPSNRGAKAPGPRKLFRAGHKQYQQSWRANVPGLEVVADNDPVVKVGIYLGVGCLLNHRALLTYFTENRNGTVRAGHPARLLEG